MASIAEVDHARRAAAGSALFDLLGHLLSGEWGGRPACADHDPELWHPLSERATHQIARAKSICRGCPIQGSCLQHATRHAETGIWGGLTEAERDQLVRTRGESPMTEGVIA